MGIQLEEDRVREVLAPWLDEPGAREGIAALVSDPFLLAFFLMSVSEGEGMGEAGVAAIREEEIARLLHDMERQQREEGGHKQGTLDLVRELFPEHFDDGRYRYTRALTGREYYVNVLQRNRERLEERGLLSRLNLYLTTTFGYEVMVVLLYGAVIEAVLGSDLPDEVRTRVAAELRRILAEEETHLEIEEQHERLLRAERAGLGPRALAMLEALERLSAADYHEAAESSMREIARTLRRYADPAAFRHEIEASAAGGGGGGAA